MENLSYAFSYGPCEVLSIDPRYPRFCEIKFWVRGQERIAYSVPYRFIRSLKDYEKI